MLEAADRFFVIEWRSDVMWIIYAIVSSFFAGITSILAKCGIKKADSNVATAIRTVVVLVFSWFMVLMTGTWDGIMQIDGRTLLFLILSGLRQVRRGYAISVPFRMATLIKLFLLISPVRFCLFFWRLFSFTKG